MSHRLSPRSGRGCFLAVVVLPLAAAGGVAALVLAFRQPDPAADRAGGEVVVTARPTQVSARAGVPPAPLTQAVLSEVTGAVTGAQPDRREVRTGEWPPTRGRWPGVLPRWGEPFRPDGSPRPGGAPPVHDVLPPIGEVLPPAPVTTTVGGAVPDPTSADPTQAPTTPPDRPTSAPVGSTAPGTPTTEPGTVPGNPPGGPSGNPTGGPSGTAPGTTPGTPPGTTPGTTAPTGRPEPGRAVRPG